MRDRVAAAFSRLSGDRREALCLRVIDERPYPEIATTLGVSEQTARARVSRGLLAISVGVLVLLARAAYAVPPTRTGVDDITGTFAAWVAGDEEGAPGTALWPKDDVPDLVRAERGRLIAEKAGVGVYVAREKMEDGTTMLLFALDEAMGMGDSVEGWRDRFEDNAAIVLGPTPFGPGNVLDERGRGNVLDERGRGNVLDERGRVVLFGVTARSVERLVMHYQDGPPLVETSVDGGFVVLVDAWRPLRELVSYDAAGRELDRLDVTDFDLRYICDKEAGCPARRC
jgi:Sigma-70, region 4